MNVKELLAQNGFDIWKISDCKWILTYNYLIINEYSTM